MAHTITLRAQGATRASAARLSSPVSSRASMYFISPCFLSAIHWGKTCNSVKSRTGAMPLRSNPAARANCLMRVVRSGNKVGNGSSIVFQTVGSTVLFRQRTVARYSVSISIKPTIALPKYPIKTRQTEDSVERPCPPDSPCHIEVCVGTRFQCSSACQHFYVVQQILLRDLQAAIGISRLQVFKRKAPAFNYFLPEVNPTKAKPTSAIVKYPALTRDSRFRFVV